MTGGGSWQCQLVTSWSPGGRSTPYIEINSSHPLNKESLLNRYIIYIYLFNKDSLLTVGYINPYLKDHPRTCKVNNHGDRKSPFSRGCGCSLLNGHEHGL